MDVGSCTDFLFISQPNKCSGCPLAGAPIAHRVLNRCDHYVRGYIVEYRLDDFGREVCFVRKDVEVS